MIVLKNQRRSNLCWLQLCILLGVLIVPLLRLTIAQDSEDNKPQKFDDNRIARHESMTTANQIQEPLKVEEISEQKAENRAASYEQMLKFQNIKKLANKISGKAAELEALSKIYTMNHPDMIRLKEEMDQLLVQIEKISKSFNAMKE